VTIAASAVGSWPVWFAPTTGLLVALAVTGLWFLSRRLPRFDSNEIGILVSFTTSGTIDPESPEVAGVLRRLAEQLRAEAQVLNTADPTVRLAVRELPRHVKVPDLQAAANVHQRTHATCLISGHGATGKRRGRSGVYLERIQLSVLHRTLPPDAQGEFNHALSLIHRVPRQYQVHFDDDVTDVHVVAANLGLVARYQIGMALAASGRVEPAVRLLRSIASPNQNAPEHARKAATVVSVLLTLPWLDKWPTPNTAPADVQKALGDSQDAVGFDETNDRAWMIVACCHFLAGDLDNARIANSRITKLAIGEAEAVPHLNLGTFATAEGQFDLALQHYLAAMRKGLALEVAQSAADWFYAAVDAYGPAYLLGLGILNEHVLDASVAPSQFREVVETLPIGSSAYGYATRRAECVDPASGEPRAHPPPSRKPTTPAGRRNKRRRRW